MAKPYGHIRAALVERSTRLSRIIDILKEAEYPLSSQDISRLAYPNSDKIMLNVSTNIGEIRSSDNVSAGYYIPPARRWEKGSYPWEDENPRYWLAAAPGWRPRWTVTADGEILRIKGEPLQTADTEIKRRTQLPIDDSNNAQKQPQTPEEIVTCKHCGEIIKGSYPWCNEEHRRLWRVALMGD